MMCTRLFIPLFIGVLWYGQLAAQGFPAEDASDPATMETRATTDVETYIFHNEAQFYAFRLGYYYGLKNNRHTLGMSVPLVHTVFKGDYAGFENTSGFGDLSISYLFVPYVVKDKLGLARWSVSMDISVPTGEYRLGRGAGTWLYKPGLVLLFRPGPAVAWYPEVHFQFSGSKANSQGGIDGIPDPDDPEKDYGVQNLSLSAPLVAQLEDWRGWFSVNALYTRSFTEGTNFFFARIQLGKMIGSNASAALKITKFIAGQPRLNVVVQANAIFFIR